ncbi:MAG: hypothetical protein LZF61_04205 [Nitrosomonas sp.]|nr:MAG: hypothetical protein LZF61_04205 [Nitrosomonas sp.]
MAANDLTPYCRHCGSLECVRIIRRVFQAFPLGFLDRRRALLIDANNALEWRWFRNIDTVSRDSALALGTPLRPVTDKLADLVSLNHTLEFIADDRAALRAPCCRSAAASSCAFPRPPHAPPARILPTPKPAQGPTNLYGRDVLTHFSGILDDMSALTVEKTDPCTECANDSISCSSSAATPRMPCSG